MATIRNRGFSRRSRLLLSAGFLVPVLAAAAFSYLVLREQAPAHQARICGRCWVLVAVEDMVPDAHENAEDTHLSRRLKKRKRDEQ